jgi:ribA/ribD-fused uncharacterized protein
MDYSNYIFFWGADKTHGYLSNFYPSPFIVDGLEYICSEQYFIKKKQEKFDTTNIELGKKIMNELIPKQIKRLGRLVKNYDDVEWNKCRYNIMKESLIHKFSQNTILKKQLLETNTKYLVEASPFDKIWGIGIKQSDAMRVFSDLWPGQNLLGKALMEVRDYFINM